ncbi:MAG: hypothetical protein JWM81_240 [Candidatus Saccharibacteria bacterium]|nr:hypothetical protein [Candidatus Saccharibacteria bacterium]
MADLAEAVQSLFVEQALVSTTQHRSDRRHGEVWGGGRRYPAQLGSLVVESLRFDPDYDASRIADGVKADFTASYVMDDPETASAVRQRSMAWLDWLSQGTNLNVHHNAYIELATIAAEHGDAEAVRQIVEDPKRLWLDKHAGIPVSDPAFGQLDRLSTDSMSGKISDIARLMVVAPEGSAEQVRAAVMPTFRNVITELVSRDLTDNGYPVGRASGQLLTIGTPEAVDQVGRLVAAMPMTPARLDVLVNLAEKDERFAAAAAEAVAWHNEKASLARQILAGYMKPYGTARDIINYPLNQSGRKDSAASQPIAAAIVDQIPAYGGEASTIETSVAFAHGSMFGGSVHGDILRCVRVLTDNPHFEFTDPQFGFAARFEDGENSYAHGLVTVVDASLPEGRMVVDLSSEPLRYSIAHDETRFLCRIIQAEKNRRVQAA